jgi:drug/metabolite transporter superfamily protein YnfA
MERIQLVFAAAAMLAIGGSMAAYEWSRIKAKRPLFGGRQIVTLYWCAYLSLLVLSVTTVAAAVLRS